MPVVSPRFVRSSVTLAARRAALRFLKARACSESRHLDKDLVAAACWVLRIDISHSLDTFTWMSNDYRDDGHHRS